MGGIVIVLLREHGMLWNTGGKIKLKICACMCFFFVVCNCPLPWGHPSTFDVSAHIHILRKTPFLLWGVS